MLYTWKKSVDCSWKSTENQPKLQFFFICLSLKPHKIQMKKDNSKIQKQASLLVFCVIFLFSNHPSKSTGSPFMEAHPKGVKVVNFVAKRLNLYPHTVLWTKNMNCKCYQFYTGVINVVTPPKQSACHLDPF